MGFFTLPTFNQSCDIWHDGTPTTDPPDLSPACQLYLNTRGLLDIDPSDDTLWQPPVWLRVPPGTDVRALDTVECPPTSGGVYHVRWIERVHLGFPNEYAVALLDQISTGGFGPVTGDSLLMESGDNVLTEGGDFILLE